MNVRRDRGALRVIGVGELDIATVDEVGGRLRNLVLDLRQLSFMGVTGLRLLVERSDEACGDAFSFIAGPATDRVLEITGWCPRLPVRLA